MFCSPVCAVVIGLLVCSVVPQFIDAHPSAHGHGYEHGDDHHYMGKWHELYFTGMEYHVVVQVGLMRTRSRIINSYQ
ncbi:hypothetical protein AHF37_06737 [Paragonimus kellicotti]|nr:hypothetical protein AHF37_06737 [Paragonimus kellicotti]